jgi:eukaryotic-like serine/threonine-protein kinase
MPISIILVVLATSLVVLLFPYFSGNVSAQSNMSMNMSSSMNMSTTTNYTNTQFLTYKNPILGVEIKHPSEWKAIEKHISNRTVVEFEPAITSEHQPLSPFVSVSIQPLSSQLTNLDSLTKGNLAIARNLPDFKLLQSNMTTLSGNPAHKIVYTFTSLDPSFISQFESMNIWTIKDDKVYTISYSESKSEYQKHLPAIQRIIDSLQIAKKA